MTDLETWLEDQYPGLYINLNHMPKKLGYSYLISGIFLQLVVTALLAALTRFNLCTPSHACWLLVWIYGGPMLRWKWLNDESIDKEPCLSAFKWVLFGIGGILSLALAVGVYGGIATICVELLGAICNAHVFASP